VSRRRKERGKKTLTSGPGVPARQREEGAGWLGHGERKRKLGRDKRGKGEELGLRLLAGPSVGRGRMGRGEGERGRSWAFSGQNKERERFSCSFIFLLFQKSFETYFKIFLNHFEF